MVKQKSKSLFYIHLYTQCIVEIHLIPNNYAYALVGAEGNDELVIHDII